MTQNKKTWKPGDIVYPHFNGTSGLFKKPRWDLVTRVDANGNILESKYIWDFSTVKAIELIQEEHESIFNRSSKMPIDIEHY